MTRSTLSIRTPTPVDNRPEWLYPEHPQPPSNEGHDMRRRGSGQSDSDKIGETLDRTRRLETRVTKLAIAMGVETEGQRPRFDAGTLFLPSPHNSLRDCVNHIPKDWLGDVQVRVGDDLVAVIRRP